MGFQSFSFRVFETHNSPFWHFRVQDFMMVEFLLAMQNPEIESFDVT
jgi:hypothetical protein